VAHLCCISWVEQRGRETGFALENLKLSYFFCFQPNVTDADMDDTGQKKSDMDDCMLPISLEFDNAAQ
jgi:hypothetical protein